MKERPESGRTTPLAGADARRRHRNGGHGAPPHGSTATAPPTVTDKSAERRTKTGCKQNVGLRLCALRRRTADKPGRMQTTTFFAGAGWSPNDPAD